ncbi:MAG: hypothetical protein Q7J44_07540 [Pseudotabrizicola sp.]|nr:hypothetical protein [Pseudotabrizicola sp.]MDO9638381.1 hypothetical protein [Pseudotabrizicola sp.]
MPIRTGPSSALGHRGRGLVKQPGDAPGKGKKLLSACRQTHATWPTVEQGGVQVGFKTLYLHADGGLRPAKQIGRAGQIAAGGDGQEGAQQFTARRVDHAGPSSEIFMSVITTIRLSDG